VENNTSMRRRLLRRPTLAETEQIARDCPFEELSVTVIVPGDSPRDWVLTRHCLSSRLRRLRRGYSEQEGERSFVRQCLLCSLSVLQKPHRSLRTSSSHETDAIRCDRT
jgi:hypothetical protein